MQGDTNKGHTHTQLRTEQAISEDIIQQGPPSTPTVLYLFGPSLIGEGNVLSLCIAAVSQNVDNGDLIHSCGESVVKSYTTTLPYFKALLYSELHVFFSAPNTRMSRAALLSSLPNTDPLIALFPRKP